MTGGCGFLGSHLARELLAHGFDTTLFDIVRQPAVDIPDGHASLRTVQGSVNDVDAVQTVLAGANVVYHLAAIANPRACSENPALARSVNVDGTRNVLEAAPDGAGFILLSSAAVYGPPRYLPIDEAHPLDGSDPYATTKKVAEELSREHTDRLDVVIVRNFNTYGPGQALSFLIPQMIRQALTESRIEVWNGRPVRDYMYVDDATRALAELAAQEGVTEATLNLGSGNGRTVAEVARIIAQEFEGIALKELNQPVTGSPALVADNQRLRTAIRWRPDVGLEQGLRRTIAWYRERVRRAGPTQ